MCEFHFHLNTSKKTKRFQNILPGALLGHDCLSSERPLLGSLPRVLWVSPDGRSGPWAEKPAWGSRGWRHNAQAFQTWGGHLLAGGPSKRCRASRACFLPRQVPHPRPLCVRRAPCRLSPRAGSRLLVGPFMELIMTQRRVCTRPGTGDKAVSEVARSLLSLGEQRMNRQTPTSQVLSCKEQGRWALDAGSELRSEAGKE